MRIAAASIAAALVLAGAPVAAAKPTDRRRARVASWYLGTHQKKNGAICVLSCEGSTADAVMAMVAARRNPKRITRALDYLARRVRNGKVTTVGQTAKVAMAAVAGGRRPRRFGGMNLVRSIKDSRQPDGRYGEGSSVFDHALAMLALGAGGTKAGHRPTAWLVAAQCRDGGWQFDGPPGDSDDDHCLGGEDDFTTSDSNTTAMTVMALRFGSGSATPATDPFEFFRSMRDGTRGGWGYSHAFGSTDSISTALVLQAFRAAGRKVPARGLRALRALQYRLCGRNAGAFAYTWSSGRRDGPSAAATIAGIMGVLKRPYPVRPAATKPMRWPGPC